MEEADFQGWAGLRGETLQATSTKAVMAAAAGRAGGRNTILTFGLKEKKVSVFNLDILCIPVNSPGVSLRSLRFEDFSRRLPDSEQLRALHKNTRENGMLGNARYVFQNFD